MEEANLLKERLQAITDKRRIQENIAMKRREIEEEKLKLQHIKKKVLREQWLMDGLSQQSEAEQEAMKLQAQDEQQQTDQWQSNIFRIEKEIEELETQELDISAKEEVVLKRLKEVERTAEDIIKDVNAEFQADLTHNVTSIFLDNASFIPLPPAKTSPICEPGSEESKKANNCPSRCIPCNVEESPWSFDGDAILNDEKATSVDGEAERKELNKSSSTTENHNSISITMETTEQSASLPVDPEMEVAVADSPEQRKGFGAHDEQHCLTLDSPGKDVMLNISLTDLPTCTIEANMPDSPDTIDCTEMAFQKQIKASILEPGHEEVNTNESIMPSLSNTISSDDRISENEIHHKRQDTPEQDPEQYPGPEKKHEPEQHPEPEKIHESEQYPEPENKNEPEQYPGPEKKDEPEQYPEPENKDGPEQHPEPEKIHEPEQYPEPEKKHEPEQYPEPEKKHEPEHYPEPEKKHEPEQYPEPDKIHEAEQYPEPGKIHEPEQYPGPDKIQESEQYPGPEKKDEPEHYPEPEKIHESEQYLMLQAGNEHNPEYAGDHNLAFNTEEDIEVNEICFEPPIREESILQQCITEQTISGVSIEYCHDLHPEEIDECETDEKWRNIFSSSINKEDDDSYLDSLQLSAQGLFVQKIEADFVDQDNDNFGEVSFEEPQVKDVQEQPEYATSFSTSIQEVKYNPLGLQGLSKISEDESENARGVNHNHTMDQQYIYDNPIKPKDFCVIQETKNDNVSTEHVDFQLARKQWREMEEQTMNKIIIPLTKQSSFHGSHSFMYTPVRNIERSQKTSHNLENLNVDYLHTQFSPCSDDSGLDDSSYKSPYHDLETPTEREICMSMERAEIVRRERGKSTGCTPSQRMPRSISTPLTPSFIITSSPTKVLKREVSADHVTILDTNNDFTYSSNHGKDSATSYSDEWHSQDNSSNVIILETSNLIIRSASEFSLNKGCEQPQEKTFLNNPFFKLRSRSSISLVDEEIKMVKQREEELRKERANLYGKDSLNTVRITSNHMDTLAFDNAVDVPMKCKSSPSSPIKTAYRMDRSALSCDHRFPDAYTGGRRKSAMAVRWEAGEFTKAN